MKRFFYIFGVLSVLFSSCTANNWAPSVITNNSAVSFKFNHTGEKQLAAGGSTEFETKAYQQLEYYSPDKRVYFTYQADDAGYTGQFKNRKSWPVKVHNAIGEEATLSAGGWMDEMANIVAGNTDDANHTGRIYTANPKFEVVTESGFPAIAQYTKPGRKFLVTIQWGP
jgi:hypothetical protein